MSHGSIPYTHQRESSPWPIGAYQYATALRALMIDLLKPAPRWFLMVLLAGSTAFGAGAGTMCGMLGLDSLARIERYAKDEWQSTLAKQAEKIAEVDALSRQNAEELKRRAQESEAFRNEIRREFDRLNLRLSKKERGQ